MKNGKLKNKLVKNIEILLIAFHSEPTIAGKFSILSFRSSLLRFKYKWQHNKWFIMFWIVGEE